MGATCSLLHIGNDPLLLSTRTAILRQRYSVVAVTIVEAWKTFEHGDFDLVVLCHTVSGKDKTELLGRIKQHSPSVLVVEVLPQYSRKSQFADEQVDSLNPEDVVGKISALLSRSLSGPPRAPLAS